MWLRTLSQANPRAVHEIERADAIVYGMGSLYTSICPILCLDGMGEAIAAQAHVPKVIQAVHDDSRQGGQRESSAELDALFCCSART